MPKRLPKRIRHTLAIGDQADTDARQYQRAGERQQRIERHRLRSMGLGVAAQAPDLVMQHRQAALDTAALPQQQQRRQHEGRPR